MKKRFLTISNSFLIGIMLYFSSCNSEKSSNARSILTDSATIAKGHNFFVNKCTGCHNFDQDGIGPQLAGITSQQPVEWIKNFIRNPKQVIDSGDSTAQKLFKQYKTLMPSFAALPEEEINAIIAYTHLQKKHVRKPVPIDTNDIKNPIVDTIESSDLVVGVDSVTQIPSSANQMPLTRITKLDYQPNTGELFILDLRGKLYKLQNGKPQIYMDIARLKPKFINQPGLGTGFGSFAFHPEFSKNGILYTTHTEPAGTAKADFSYADTIPVVMQWILTEWKTTPLEYLAEYKKFLE